MTKRLALRAALAFMTLAALWTGGLVWFAEDARRAASRFDERSTDAIVVLTGGSKRIAEGVDLLVAGRARLLFVSGVARGVRLEDILREAKASEAKALECCVMLGHAALDTVGNAVETAAWAQENQIASLRLVTANYHMRRSLLEFQEWMPHVLIVPHAVDPDAVMVDEWWRWSGTARLMVTEYNKYLAALVRSWLRTRPTDGTAI